MNLHMIITISGIFVGMVVLLYGIISYDKLKKDDESSLDVKKDNLAPKENAEELKKEDIAFVKEEVKKKDEDEKPKAKEVGDIKKPLSKSVAENKEISEFMTEEFDNTLVLDKDDSTESVVKIESVTEVPNDEKITSDVEDLFD